MDAGGSYVTAFNFRGALVFPGGTNPSRSISSLGQRDNGLVRYDFLGNLQWAIRWGNGSDADRPVAMACGRDGAIYVMGVYEGTINLNPGAGVAQNVTSKGGTDVYLLKLGSNGSLIWARTFGGAGNDMARALTVTGDGSIAAALTYSGVIDADPSPTVTRELGSQGGLDILMLRLTGAGDLIWASSIGGPQDDGTAGVSMAIDEGGRVLVAGTFTGSIGLVPGSPITSFTSQGNHDVFIAAYDAQGKFVTSRALQGVGDIRLIPTSLAVDSADNLYVAGNFRQSFDVDPSFSSQRILNSRSASSDFFVASFTPNFTVRWANHLGLFGEDLLASMQVDRNGSIVLGGQFNSQLNLNPVEGNPRLISPTGLAGATDGFVAKYRAMDGTFVSGWNLGTPGSGPQLQNTVAAAGLDTMGNIVVAGQLLGANMNVATSGAPVLLSTSGGADMFLASYNWRGNLRVPLSEVAGPVLRATTNAASFSPGPVVPGGLASLFGLNITTRSPGFVTPDVARAIPIAKTLCNTEVVFRSMTTADEWKAPILFCSDSQVNYQVPAELPVNSYVTLHLNVDGQMSNDMETLVQNDEIGVFMDDVAARNPAMVYALGVRTGQKLSQANPANACDIVEAFVTGLGPSQTGFPDDGTPAGGALRAQGDAKLVLFDDGTQGRLVGFEAPPRFVEFTRANGAILYTGFSPEFVGLYQINVRFPNPGASITPPTLRLNQGLYPSYFEYRGRRSREFLIRIQYTLATSPCQGGFQPLP
ncbi:MAG: hypothetical protein MUF01_01530 [Bryobacterales bacterium]|nr:hypothetical protein [Bryobacterales bacterium]